MASKRHEHLTLHHLGNTKTSTRLQQGRKMPSLPLPKTSNYHPPITKHPAKQKIRNSIQTNTYFHISTHPHNPSILAITPQLLKSPPRMTPQHTRRTVSTTFLHQTTRPTHCKYHPPPLNVYIHLHAFPQLVDIMLAKFS